MRKQVTLIIGALAVGCSAASMNSNSRNYLAFEENHFESIAETKWGGQISPELISLFDIEREDDVKVSRSNQRKCRVFPGEATWPTETLWKAVGLVLGKQALIKTVTLAAPCYHGQYYNQTTCAALSANWTSSYLHMTDPTSMMSPVYQGLTCQVTTDPTQNCTLGAFPSYAVNVSSVLQIQIAVNFARSLNLRLVIKNTGHDFSGKSGGAGALSIWTHNLKEIKYIEQYSSSGSEYTGPAFMAGVGVQAYEIYKEAYARGLMVVGGEGQTVGVMGGYIQGGGHSPLSSIHGMAADQVLSMNVVTANGHFVTADFEQNTELFWALRGGGGSAFGVVTSVTVKAYPDIPVTASRFSFTVGGNNGTITSENFWKGVRFYLDYFPSLSAQGIYAYWFIISTGTGPLFLMQPFFAPNKTLLETNALLAPWFAQLTSLEITFVPATTYYNSFYTAWMASFPLEVVQKTHVATGSRLFPKQNWDDASSLDATFDAIKASSEAGLTIIGFIIDPSVHGTNDPDNAVNPAWRNTYAHVLQSVSWTEGSSAAVQHATRQNFTFGHMQRWRDVSPGAGAYLGESDILEPDFQQCFYGTKYQRLLDLKREIDPRDVFFAQTAVGSESGQVITANGLPSGNGKLCRV